MGLLDPNTSDGRVIFFLPWENLTIAGTTDSPTKVTHAPAPLEENIQFILSEVENYLSPEVHGKFKTSNITSRQSNSKVWHYNTLRQIEINMSGFLIRQCEFDYGRRPFFLITGDSVRTPCNYPATFIFCYGF